MESSHRNAVLKDLEHINYVIRSTVIVQVIYYYSIHVAYYILYNNTPGLTDPSLLPYDGDFTLIGTDGSMHLIEFQSHLGSYQMTQTTIERDGTTTLLSETVTPTAHSGTYTIQPCRYNLNIRMHHRYKVAYLAVNGKKVIQLNAKSVTVQAEDRVTYSNNTVNITGTNEYSSSNITVLWYYDTFCFYPFTSRKSEPLFGPGTLFVGNRLGLYSTSSKLSEKIQSLTQSLTQSEPSITRGGSVTEHRNEQDWKQGSVSVTEHRNEQDWKQGSVKKGSPYTSKKRVRRQTAAWTVSEWSEVRDMIEISISGTACCSGQYNNISLPPPPPPPPSPYSAQQPVGVG